jgi:hypothetical protein
MAEIKAHPWFQEHYVPVLPPYDDDDDDDDSVKQIGGGKTTHHINAFQLIGMASSLDLSGFFEEEVRCGVWTTNILATSFSFFLFSITAICLLLIKTVRCTATDI